MTHSQAESRGNGPALGFVADAAWERDLDGTRILYGVGRLDELGSLTRDLGGRRILLVADAGITAAGHSHRALASLRGAELEARLFDAIAENPTGDDVAAGAEAAAEHRADFLVAVGGGSPMDCAKGINFVHTLGGRMPDYEGFAEATGPMLPSIGVPTTAGTGSEVQSYALITDAESGRKMACGAPQARFRAVILDPALTDSMPHEVAAAAALDAISHAVESHVTRRRSPESSRLAVLAWTLLEGHVAAALDNPGDHPAWGTLQIAALLAGAAIERSMLGAAHACANPLTRRYGTVHGIAVALMLPHVVRFNATEVDPLYAKLLEASGQAPAEGVSAGESLAARLEELRAGAGLPSRLAEVGVRAEDIDELASQATGQWTLAFNPREVSQEDLVNLYRHAL